MELIIGASIFIIGLIVFIAAVIYSTIEADRTFVRQYMTWKK
jgi:hypothetical protein